MENENKSLKNNQSSLQSKYSDLKRSGLQLEKFRKSIAQMVELSPQVTFEEPSLMFDHPSLKSLKLSASPTPSSSVEGVSPSPKNVSKHDRSKKIEMTPTSTLKRNVSPLRSSSTFEKSSFSAHEDIDSHDHSYTSSTEKV
ncbi:hypothetical protein HMI56_000056 [Coelomomyces lativittatus]|nr:hypothetical protein HMI56_000056 [Coelomomyces lativittatus]